MIVKDLNQRFIQDKQKADYDGSVSLENGYTADDKMYAFQSGLNYKKDNELKSLIFHYNKYDRGIRRKWNLG